MIFIWFGGSQTYCIDLLQTFQNILYKSNGKIGEKNFNC